MAARGCAAWLARHRHWDSTSPGRRVYLLWVGWSAAIRAGVGKLNIYPGNLISHDRTELDVSWDMDGSPHHSSPKLVCTQKLSGSLLIILQSLLDLEISSPLSIFFVSSVPLRLSRSVSTFSLVFEPKPTTRNCREQSRGYRPRNPPSTVTCSLVYKELGLIAKALRRWLISRVSIRIPPQLSAQVSRLRCTPSP